MFESDSWKGKAFKLWSPFVVKHWDLSTLTAVGCGGSFTVDRMSCMNAFSDFERDSG